MRTAVAALVLVLTSSARSLPDLFAEHARAIDRLGGDVLDDDGQQAVIDSPEMAEVFALYRRLYEEGAAGPASKDEAGPTWLGALRNGTIGIAPGPSVWLGLIEEQSDIDMGVAPIPGVPTRTDLAENKYSQADPRLVTVNSLMAKGKTPYARNFNASFNDSQSPWLETVRGALFGDAATALADGNTAITESLQQGS